MHVFASPQERVDAVDAADEHQTEEPSEEDGEDGEEDVGHVVGHLVVLGNDLVHVAQEHRHLQREEEREGGSALHERNIYSYS